MARVDRSIATWGCEGSFRIPTAAEFVAACDQSRMRLWDQFQMQGHGQALRMNLFQASLVSDALNRYHKGYRDHHNPADNFDKAVQGNLLVDIYFLTSKFMRQVMSESETRGLFDCAVLPVLRGLHWAAAEALGILFPGTGLKNFKHASDRAELFVNNTQRMHLNESSYKIDNNAHFSKNLIYLRDGSEMEAVRAHVVNGLLFMKNPASQELLPLTTLSWIHTGLRDDEDNRTHDPAVHGAQNGVGGFVMSLQREVYIRKHRQNQDPTNTNSSYFFHSSYLHGNDVVGAGNIMVDRGQILLIDNGSGHYLPGHDSVLRVLQTFRALGVKLDNTKVRLVGHDHAMDANDILADPEIITLQAFELPVHLYIELKDAITAYENKPRGRFSRPLGADERRMIEKLKVKDGKGFIEMCMWVAYGDMSRNQRYQGNWTTKQKTLLQDFSARNSVDLIDTNAGLRDALKKVLGSSMKKYIN